MKARIQTVEQLKQVASAKLQDEFNQRYQEATLEGAVQGMAFVMYALEMGQGWKKSRQQKLFENMMGLCDIPESAPWLNPYNALDIRKHIETEFGIDFSKLLNRVEALPPEE
jgi:hypothetical protein